MAREECLAGAASRIQPSEAGAVLRWQPGNLAGHVDMRRRCRVATDHQVKIIVGLVARCVEERAQPDVPVLCGNASRVGVGRYLRFVPRHLLLRRQRADEIGEVAEDLRLRRRNGELGSLAVRAPKLSPGTAAAPNGVTAACAIGAPVASTSLVLRMRYSGPPGEGAGAARTGRR